MDRSSPGQERHSTVRMPPIYLLHEGVSLAIRQRLGRAVRVEFTPVHRVP